jgi:hypothetical protein
VVTQAFPAGQAVAQQIPLTQWLFVQSWLTEHICPSSARHFPPAQVYPARHAFAPLLQGLLQPPGAQL